MIAEITQNFGVGGSLRLFLSILQHHRRSRIHSAYPHAHALALTPLTPPFTSWSRRDRGCCDQIRLRMQQVTNTTADDTTDAKDVTRVVGGGPGMVVRVRLGLSAQDLVSLGMCG